MEQANTTLVLVFLLIFCSGFVAILEIAEIAFWALSEQYQREPQKHKGAGRLQYLLKQPDILHMSIHFMKLCLTFALVVLLTLVAFSLGSISPSEKVAVISIPGAVLLLYYLLHEFVLKIVVLKNPLAYARRVSFAALFSLKVCAPFMRWMKKNQQALAKKYQLPAGSNGPGSPGIATLVDAEESFDHLQDNEREMIHSIYEFGETEVHEVMVPRTDIVSIEDTAGIDTLRKVIQEKGHSRIPLYHEDIDNVLGIIHVKDLLTISVKKEKPAVDLQELARPAYFVPENKKLDDLLKEFQREKHHMAIVVDEYGGTAGLITLEDVIEEIVGDIQDEYDQEKPLYQKINESTYSVDAKIDLHELNEILDIDLPTEGEYESLGGFILTLTGYVPEVNEIVEYRHFTFKIDKVVRNRIIRVILRIHEPQDVDEEVGETRSE